MLYEVITFNDTDSVLVIMNNGYSSATGQQLLPSSTYDQPRPNGMTIRRALEGIGVKWLETVTTYHVGKMVKTLRRALTTEEKA